MALKTCICNQIAPREAEAGMCYVYRNTGLTRALLAHDTMFLKFLSMAHIQPLSSPHLHQNGSHNPHLNAPVMAPSPRHFYNTKGGQHRPSSHSPTTSWLWHWSQLLSSLITSCLDHNTMSLTSLPKFQSSLCSPQWAWGAFARYVFVWHCFLRKRSRNFLSPLGWEPKSFLWLAKPYLVVTPNIPAVWTHTICSLALGSSHTALSSPQKCQTHPGTGCSFTWSQLFPVVLSPSLGLGTTYNSCRWHPVFCFVNF